MRRLPTAAAAFTLVLLAACATSQSDAPAIDASDDKASLRLYVFDCGTLTLDDVAAFGLTNEETDVRELFVPCYLVVHDRGTLLWDAGLPLAVAGAGDVALQPGAVMRYERSILDQLTDMGMSPEDVGFAAYSHMHFDHVGAANAFAASALLIQGAEYQAAFEHAGDFEGVFQPELYAALASSPKTLLNGDHDVFGDGSVMILSAPGHTPGHQVLALELDNTGPIVLSGDLYHFRFSRAHERTPVFNHDAEQTVQSMRRIEAYLKATNATLWIEHDAAFAATLKKAPAYYD